MTMLFIQREVEGRSARRQRRGRVEEREHDDGERFHPRFLLPFAFRLPLRSQSLAVVVATAACSLRSHTTASITLLSLFLSPPIPPPLPPLTLDAK